MANTTTTTNRRETTNDAQKKVALVFGSAFLLIGILGPIIGGGQEGELIIFGRNYLHDVIHLASGAAGIAAALYAAGRYAGAYLKGFGIVYLLVTVVGFLAPELLGDLIHLNSADNWLHVVLTIGLLAAGFGLDDRND